jgi:hypothetical protein
MSKRKIVVEYDGEYPCACMGTLKVSVDEKEVYNKQYCCNSTGSVWFGEDWEEHVEPGELLWNDADKFDQDIQEAVKAKLSEIGVCGGGCV